MSFLTANSKMILPFPVLLLLSDYALPISARSERAWDAYNLPYRTLGMITHCVMLWNLACHLCGRSPLLPWRRLKPEFSWYDMANVGVTTIVSICLLAVNMSSPKDRSPGMTSPAALHLVYNLVEEAVVAHRFIRERGWEKKGKQSESYCSGYTLEQEKTAAMRWEYTPWFFVLMVASLINSQILGTLDDIGRNPRLNGVTHFDTRTKMTTPTGLVLSICAIGGGIIAPLTLFCWTNRLQRLQTYGAYAFVLSGLVCCLGFILAMDYAVGVVTGNNMGEPAVRAGVYFLAVSAVAPVYVE
ncbi:hypothetical protein QBC37DRAFT_451481 [Rhypophila decipiens]|uniref:Uncharacterized protein n=1 Tax=Rhypophila decipiens TaxID=261697 RepID=A0AAN7B3T5_9PEZI|nr:hypothetical protein QBC37DRAFT_451481 [Rhypophila decipiens]